MSTGQKGGYSASAGGAIVNYDCYAFSIYSEADGKVESFMNQDILMQTMIISI